MTPGALESVTTKSAHQPIHTARIETITRDPSRTIVERLSSRDAAQHIEQVEFRRPRADDASRKPAAMCHVDHEEARRPCRRT
jgi:phosphopantothenoylcysteine synthetase/decarboxylase